jgi:hypothetical protein
VRSLALIGATGLYVPRAPIADIFMLVQAKNGGDFSDYRRTLFRDAAAPEALAMFPDGRMTPERELLRYRMFRFASRVGFAPPYLHDRKLRERLSRFTGPAVVIAGERDNLVPVVHARAYAEGLRGAELKLIPDAGNAVAAWRSRPKLPRRHWRASNEPRQLPGWLDERKSASPVREAAMNAPRDKTERRFECCTKRFSRRWRSHWFAVFAVSDRRCKLPTLRFS